MPTPPEQDPPVIRRPKIALTFAERKAIADRQRAEMFKDCTWTIPAEGGPGSRVIGWAEKKALEDAQKAEMIAARQKPRPKADPAGPLPDSITPQAAYADCVKEFNEGRQPDPLLISRALCPDRLGPHDSPEPRPMVIRPYPRRPRGMGHG